MRRTFKATGRIWLSLLLIGSSWACGDDDSPTDAGADATGDARVDAGEEPDGGAPDDVGTSDAGPDAADDGGLDAADDAMAPDGGFVDSCEGACAQTNLVAEFGDAREMFDVAYFGFNKDGTLYIEAYAGAAEGCPMMDSPSPDRTLIIGALPVPSDDARTSVTASFLDFLGTLTEAPFLSSMSAESIGRAVRTEPRADGFVRIDFSAVFEGGTIEGAVYATYCASLDT